MVEGGWEMGSALVEVACLIFCTKRNGSLLHSGLLIE